MNPHPPDRKADPIDAGGSAPGSTKPRLGRHVSILHQILMGIVLGILIYVITLLVTIYT